MGRTLRHRKHKSKQEFPSPFSFSLHNDPTIITLLKTLKLKSWRNETELRLRHFVHTGRGVCSKRNLNANDLLIKIPVNSMISLSTFTKDDFPFINFDVIKTTRSKLSMQTLLALFICNEKRNKLSKSLWKFYLDSLPAGNPLTWLQLTPPEVTILPVHVSSAMGKFQATFDCSWESVLNNVNVNLPDCMITKDLFAWCYSMVNTRAVYIDPSFVMSKLRGENRIFVDLLSDAPNLALCPFLDMFNHSTEAGAQTESEITDESFYTLKTYRKFKKHEQIFISYGAHNNVKLFIEYGFFIENNPFDLWPFQLHEVCRHLRLTIDAKQYKYLMSKKFNEDLYVTHDGQLSFNFKALLFVSSRCGQFQRIYCDAYTPDEIDLFVAFAARLMDIQWTLLTSKQSKHFSDKMTHVFYEYLINFSILAAHRLRNLGQHENTT